MSELLQFECPHCHQIVSVPSVQLGRQITCTHCNKPFQTQAPVAREVTGGRAAAAENGGKPGEETLLTTHPAIFRCHPFMTLLGLAIIAGGIVAMMMGGPPGVVGGATGIVLVLGYFFWQWIKSVSVRLSVTTQRTILIRGLVSRKTSEVQHEDVRNIQCNQNVVERLLNYGDLAVSSSGQDEMEIVIQDIPDPQRVVNLIRQHQ